MNQAQLDEVIWELHVPMLRLAFSILRHPQNAEDAVSNAVISAYQKLHTLRDEAALKPWMMKITARCCYDLMRKGKRETLMENTPEKCVTPFEEPPGDTLLMHLNQLPYGQAQVLTLYYYDGFSTAEIARILGLPRPTVSMRMSRGRAKLKEILEVEQDGTGTF